MHVEISILLCSILLPASAKTIDFSGFTWDVKSGEKLGPGPNDWDENDAVVDNRGLLHLNISNRKGKWQCAEVVSHEWFHFGIFQLHAVGAIDRQDPSIVFGMFTYPKGGVPGPDGTNEIDMEVSRWGSPSRPTNANYAVFPAVSGVPYTPHHFKFNLTGSYSTHRFTWSTKSILFQSLHGHQPPSSDANEYHRWLFTPPEPLRQIPQKPCGIRINLWLASGQPPIDGKPAEVTITDFTFVPR